MGFSFLFKGFTAQGSEGSRGLAGADASLTLTLRRQTSSATPTSPLIGKAAARAMRAPIEVRTNSADDTALGDEHGIGSYTLEPG